MLIPVLGKEAIVTPEEMQRAMDFIIEMQAKSSAKIDALAQAQKHDQKEAEERWKRADERWTRTEEGIRALLFKVHDRQSRGKIRGDS